MKGRPLRTPVIATCTTTGKETRFASVRAAVREGGFTYTSVRNCMHGLTPVHAGHTFRADGPMRKLKPNNLISRVAALRNKGLRNPEIAKRLEITLGTVSVYATLARNAGLCETWHETKESMDFKGRA